RRRGHQVWIDRRQVGRRLFGDDFFLQRRRPCFASTLLLLRLAAPKQGERRGARNKYSPPHHPTLPSRLTSSSFCASTANSIGSFCSTSRTNPFTRSATA